MTYKRPLTAEELYYQESFPVSNHACIEVNNSRVWAMSLAAGSIVFNIFESHTIFLNLFKYHSISDGNIPPMVLLCSFGILGCVLMKFIIAIYILHLAHYNTERTFKAMNEFANLSYVYAFFVSLLSVAIYVACEYHQTKVEALYAGESQAAILSNIVGVLLEVKLYLLFQAFFFFGMIYQAKVFSTKEQANE